MLPKNHVYSHHCASNSVVVRVAMSHVVDDKFQIAVVDYLLQSLGWVLRSSKVLTATDNRIHSCHCT